MKMWGAGEGQRRWNGTGEASGAAQSCGCTYTGDDCDIARKQTLGVRERRRNRGKTLLSRRHGSLIINGGG